MRTVLLVLASAALNALAFAPWSLWPLAAVALVPLFVACARLSPARAAAAGLLWGTAAIWGVGYWVPMALSFYWQQPVWFGVLFALLASIIFAGSYTAGFAACAAWICGRCAGAPRALLLAALWVAWELARGRLLTGDPWLLLGYALMPAPRLIQLADAGGVYALSFVVALSNAALAELVLWRLAGPSRRRAAPAGALAVAVGVVLFAVAYGTYRLSAPATVGPPLRVALIQGNSDPGRLWRAELQGAELRRYLELSRAALEEEPTDLLVWPENSVTFFLAHQPEFAAQVAALPRETGVDLLLGGPHHANGAAETDVRYFNSAFYIPASGEIGARYDKRHLLPFAEYFPLRTIELLRRNFERVRSFTPGSEALLLQTRFGRLAAAICFEGIFPELVRRQMAEGARLLVNLSNDAWLGSGAGPEQHLSMVALRAVEHRTWVVRATTTGVSAIVDPHGVVRARAPSGEAAVLSGVVHLGPQVTPYQRIGDAFAWLCVVISAAGILWRVVWLRDEQDAPH